MAENNCCKAVTWQCYNQTLKSATLQVL